jgi:hypothetical protein
MARGKVKIEDSDVEWNELGRRLRRHDPEKYRQLLAVARAFVDLYERGLVEREWFAAQLRDISRGSGAAN